MADPSHVITTLCMGGGGGVLSVQNEGLMEWWDGSRPHGVVPWYDML
jgi:hypothetical protein